MYSSVLVRRCTASGACCTGRRARRVGPPALRGGMARSDEALAALQLAAGGHLSRWVT